MYAWLYTYFISLSIYIYVYIYICIFIYMCVLYQCEPTHLHAVSQSTQSELKPRQLIGKVYLCGLHGIIWMACLTSGMWRNVRWGGYPPRLRWYSPGVSPPTRSGPLPTHWEGVSPSHGMNAIGKVKRVMDTGATSIAGGWPDNCFKGWVPLGRLSHLSQQSVCHCAHVPVLVRRCSCMCRCVSIVNAQLVAGRLCLCWLSWNTLPATPQF